MTGSQQTVDHLAAAPSRPDGNEADLLYLERAHAALGPVLTACSAAAAHGASSGLRALAQSTRAEQVRQLAAISACLGMWRSPGTEVRPLGTADALAGLRGAALHEAFVDHLTAHAHASIAAARAELVTGASSSARQVAERVIHAEDRRLAALARLHAPDAS
jgi:uncharacterized protein (DUF305 family)